MEHNCTVAKEDPILSKLKWHQRIKLISPDNPQRLSYFRSDVSIKDERYRHLRINKYAIHPFSTFRAWYEVFLVYFYSSVLITKPFDGAFVNQPFLEDHPVYEYYTLFTDGLNLVDIIINFFTGYVVPREKYIELRGWPIVKNYLFGPYFIFDVVSSIPKVNVYIFFPHTGKYIVGVITIMGLLKVIRMGTFVKCLWRSAMYFEVKSLGKLFLMCSLLVSFLLVHWMACFQFSIPNLIRNTFVETLVLYDKSWFVVTNIFKLSTLGQYTHGLFKSSAYMLGIRLDLYHIDTPEEYLLTIFTYFLGKILIAYIWIILAVAIVNARLMEITFLEIINQLQEYMRQKQLPLTLRGRILHYFNFKYRNRFFKEQLINDLLSDNLRNEANLHVCKLLIKNVPLFSDLTPMQLRKIVGCLILEIFMPNDFIVQAGTLGDAMYFLLSGTVAVYSRAGREICHLQDGAYFGEISLLLKDQPRCATIVALETSQIYRLKKNDFEKCLVINKVVKAKLLKSAERKLQDITKLDEEYKKKLFEESFRKMAFSDH